MCDGVVFVGMALRASGGQPHPGRACGGHAIDGGVKTKLKGIDATLFIELRVPMEASCNALILSRPREHVPGELFDGELVEGHVSVETANHPVAVGPHAAWSVLFVAIGVGVAGNIQPLAPPLFPVGRGGQKAIHDANVGFLAAFPGKGFHFFWCRGQSRQIEVKAAKQHVGRGWLRGLKAVLVHGLPEEGVDRVFPPTIAVAGNRRLLRGDEGPVPVVGGAGFDPLVQ